MTSEDFAEEQAYAILEPWGNERSDLQAAIVAQASSFGFRKENNTPFSLSDFMPLAEKEEPTISDIKAAWSNVLGRPTG